MPDGTRYYSNHDGTRYYSNHDGTRCSKVLLVNTGAAYLLNSYRIELLSLQWLESLVT